MLRGFEIAEFDGASGHRFGGLPTYAVRRVRDGAWMFVPQDSVSLVWAARRLWSFREALREGMRGRSYEDYTWTVERFELRPKGKDDLDATLEWQHRLQARPPGTPHRLAFVSGTARKVVQLRYTETDFPGSVYLALAEDGDATEFEKRADALAHLGLLKRTAAARPALPDVPERGALEPLLATPGDDEVRRRYASAIGGPRGEYIELSLLPRPTKSDRARLKGLLKSHRAEWSRPLGLNLSGQRWARGFAVRAVSTTSATPANLAHPEWGFVEEIPGNSKLPPPDFMDSLTSLGVFNTASWLRRRSSPWNALRSLLVRLGEAELIASDRPRFPRLEEVELYVKAEDFGAPEVVDLGTHICALRLSGPPPPGGLAAVLERLATSHVSRLTYSPHQGLNGGIELTRGEDGSFRALKELPRTNKASVLRWLEELPDERFDTISSKLSAAEVQRWLRRPSF